MPQIISLDSQTCEFEPCYEFVPFKKGCYSFTAVADKAKLTEKGFLAEGEDWRLTDAGLKAARVSFDMSAKLKTFSDKRVQLRGESLVAQ
mgnify:CR=1 FL=1